MTAITASDAGEANAIIGAARASTTPHRLDPGGYYVVHTPDGVQEFDLTGDEHRDFPKFKSGHVVVRDVPSFARYYGKHASADSEVFADLDAATITAVLDAHGPQDGSDEFGGLARWQQHRLTLAMRKTPQWVTWTGKDNRDGARLMDQQAFAEFLEDNAGDIAADGPVSAADLIELAQEFHARTKVAFSSGKRLKSGQTQFEYSETIEATARVERGVIAVPDEFHLALRPFEDCDMFRVKARFRYRLDHGQLRLGYRLNDPDGVTRKAVDEVVTLTQEACQGIAIMRGKPVPT